MTNVTALTATQVRLNAAAGTFTDMAVGSYFFYTNTISQMTLDISGVWEVQAKAGDGSSITYETNNQGVPSAFNAKTGGVVTPIKTVIKAAPNSSLFYIQGNGLGLLKHMVLVGTSGKPARITIGDLPVDGPGLTSATPRSASMGFIPGSLEL